MRPNRNHGTNPTNPRTNENQSTTEVMKRLKMWASHPPLRGPRPPTRHVKRTGTSSARRFVYIHRGRRGAETGTSTWVTGICCTGTVVGIYRLSLGPGPRGPSCYTRCSRAVARNIYIRGRQKPLSRAICTRVLRRSRGKGPAGAARVTCEPTTAVSKLYIVVRRA